jgi:hypothetical protein
VVLDQTMPANPPSAAGQLLDDLGPISPELILVSDPEVAQRARALLPAFGYVPWQSLGSDPVGTESAAPICEPPPAGREDAPPVRRRLARRVVMTVLLLAAGTAGFALAGSWTARDNSRPTLLSESVSTSGVAVTTLVPARTFAWEPTPGARSYVVRLFFERKLIYEGRSPIAKLTLPRRIRFMAGGYRWEVRPVGADNRIGSPIVDSTFTIAAQQEAPGSG